MSSLEKAKALVRSTAKLATRVLPLAALAVSAHAGTVFGFSVASATCFGGSGTASGTVLNSSVSNPDDSQGIKLYTSSGGCLLSDLSGSGGLLVLSADGYYDGPSLEQFPLSVSFTPFSDVGGTISYSFHLMLNNADAYTSGLQEVESGTEVNLGPVTVASTGELFNWFVDLRINQFGANTLTLIVPEHSIDLNVVSDVPEPASLLLLTPAAAWLVLRRRKMVL